LDKKKKKTVLLNDHNDASVSASASASVLVSVTPFVEDVCVSLDEYAKSNVLIDEDPEDEEKKTPTCVLVWSAQL
jgi:hypothetical protein